MSPLTIKPVFNKNQAHTNMRDNGTVITNGGLSDSETDFGTKLYFTDVRQRYSKIS